MATIYSCFQSHSNKSTSREKLTGKKPKEKDKRNKYKAAKRNEVDSRSDLMKFDDQEITSADEPSALSTTDSTSFTKVCLFDFCDVSRLENYIIIVKQKKYDVSWYRCGHSSK